MSWLTENSGVLLTCRIINPQNYSPGQMSYYDTQFNPLGPSSFPNYQYYSNPPSYYPVQSQLQYQNNQMGYPYQQVYNPMQMRYHNQQRPNKLQRKLQTFIARTAGYPSPFGAVIN